MRAFLRVCCSTLRFIRLRFPFDIAVVGYDVRFPFDVAVVGYDVELMVGFL